MASKIKVNNIQDTGSNDIITSDGAGNITLNATLDNFTSTGIDDNATSTAITIDSSEKVGIGTSSPKTFLHLLGDAPTYNFSAGTDTTANLALINDNGNAGTGASIVFGSIYAGTSDVANARIFAERENTGSTDAGAADLIFEVGNDSGSSLIERMRINSSGYLLVGQTSQSGVGGIFIKPNADGSTANLDFNKGSPSSTGALRLLYNGSFVGGISYSSSAVSYNTTSDYRLKENVVDMTSATARVKQLQPKRFNFIADADTIVDGFLAHEVSSIVPEAITGKHNEVEVWKEGEELPEGVSVGDNKLDDEGNTIPVYQGIDQSKLVPLLTASLQEAIAKIETLESTVADLTTRLEALENN